MMNIDLSMFDDILASGVCSDARRQMIEDMKLDAIEKAVLERHKHRIGIKGGTGPTAGYYRTKIYQDGKRKDLYGKDYHDIIMKLAKFYDDNAVKTFKIVFDEWEKSIQNTIKPKTIKEHRYKVDHMKVLWDKDIAKITKEDILAWLDDFLKTNPQCDALRRHTQILNNIFDHALEKEYITRSPMATIKASKYYINCAEPRRLPEETLFSPEEERSIADDIKSRPVCAYGLVTLFSIETGCRAAEICGIHKTDVQGGYIHVHCQLVREGSTYVELPYLKNEKGMSKGGRLIPISKNLREIINQAMKLPGESEYLFHHGDVHCKTNTYGQNLRERCKRLGISTTNNHAFRVAYNNMLVERGLPVIDRALLLGHSVQTNEAYYTKPDKRRIGAIKKKLRGRGVL